MGDDAGEGVVAIQSRLERLEGEVLANREDVGLGPQERWGKLGSRVVLTLFRI